MKYIDLDSCIIQDDKIICDYKKPKFEQDPTIIGRGDVVKYTADSREEFRVEAPPYTAHDIGISIPFGPAPGAPSLEISTGIAFPFTIFPIPSKVVDRMGQSWIPLPFQAGPEDKFQGLPDISAESPSELATEVVNPKKYEAYPYEKE